MLVHVLSHAFCGLLIVIYVLKMVKSTKIHLIDLIKTYPKLKIDGKNLFCGLCDVKIKWTSQHGASKTKLHCEGKKHLEKFNGNTLKSQTLQEAIDKANSKKFGNDEFSEFLAKKLIESDIPLSKVDNSSFKSLLELIPGRNIPHSTTLRNKMDGIYQKTIEKIRNQIGDDNIYFEIDETTDLKGRFVCNVLVGSLNGNEPKSMLLCTRFLEEVNNGTINRTINDACYLLRNGNVNNENLNLVVLDQASYMLKAIENLKKAELYPNLNQITCLCHALNRVCEVIRIEHPEVNEMISSIKKILLKSNKRKINFCKETKLTLPPDVIVTRWSSWLKAAFYYGNNFDKIKEFIKNLKDKSKAIASAKKLMESTDLRSKLLDSMQYTFLPKAIEKLEFKGLKFDEQI